MEKQFFSPLYDPIGGGFRRYTSDKERFEPHFEKMLIDNALLLEAYAHMFHETGKTLFQKIAYEIDSFIETTLKSDWAYASSLSADHANEEGGHSLFSYEELQDVLDPHELAFCIRHLGAAQEGFFEGENVLYQTAEWDLKHQKTFESLKKKLLVVIEERGELEIDTKILLSSNASYANSLIKAGYYLKDRSLIQKGIKLTETLIEHFYKNKELIHSFSEDASLGHALLEDYACFIKTILTAFETGDFPIGFEVVQQLLKDVELHFKCPEGGYFSTSLKDTFLVRIKPFLDGTEPSSNGLMAENFLRLYGITHKYDHLRQAEAILKLATEKMIHHPASTLTLFLDLLFFVSKDKKTIFLKKDLKDNTNYCFCHPFTSVVVCHPLLTASIPATQGKLCINNKTTVYLCTPTSCSEPIDDLEKLGVPWNHVL